MLKQFRMVFRLVITKIDNLIIAPIESSVKAYGIVIIFLQNLIKYKTQSLYSSSLSVCVHDRKHQEGRILNLLP